MDYKTVPLSDCQWYMNILLLRAKADLKNGLKEMAYDNLRNALCLANRIKNMRCAGLIMVAMGKVKNV